jgi:hypothetical protein
MQMFSTDDLDVLNALAIAPSMAVDNAMNHEQLLKEVLARAAYGCFMPQHDVDETASLYRYMKFFGKKRNDD